MDVITRLAAFLIALLLAIDAYSGERNETLRVGGHSRVLRWHRDDVYRLHFTGGRVESCAVAKTVFDALRDGDEVAVATSRVFKSCDAIRRGDALITEAHLRKWLVLLPMAFLLAAAVGWIQFTGRADDDPRDARGGWFGW
ncbi:MAG: hypothetical protein ABIR54_19560 [Burkholderiaceae bacterium]